MNITPTQRMASKQCDFTHEGDRYRLWFKFAKQTVFDMTMTSSKVKAYHKVKAYYGGGGGG